MSSDELETRFTAMLQRLGDVYDGIGHSTGRPYLYFVYPPGAEQRLRKLADEQMTSNDSLSFLHLDLVAVTIESLSGQEERRAAFLNDPTKRDDAGKAIVRLWARQLEKRIDAYLAELNGPGRPVVVLRGLAALYPLGNPTQLMEAIAEREPRSPRTGRVAPFVLLTPGTHPPQSSRTYNFLGLADQQLSFYRGEEI
ncbi:MAG: hypothetical protein R6W76_18720 [Caldilinea sp.]